MMRKPKEKPTFVKNFLTVFFFTIVIGCIGIAIYNFGDLAGRNFNEKYESAMSGAVIEDVLALVGKAKEEEKISEIDKRVKEHYKDQFEKVLSGELTEKQFLKNLSALDISKRFDEFKLQLTEKTQKVSISKEKYQIGLLSIENGKFDNAIANFNEVIALNTHLVQESVAQIQTARDVFLPQYIEDAKNQIYKYEFDKARETIAFLKNVDPGNSLVQTLDYSTQNLVKFDGTINHIFFHPLIAYTARAFDGGGGAKGQDDYMTTVLEFNRIIKQLYEDNFILIDINYLFDAEFDENGKTIGLTRRDVYVPSGKTPIILSVDDVNYYKYMKKDGQVYKLVLDENGDVVTYSQDMKGNDVYANDNEIIPILDMFVADNPDFSFAGSKGTLALTGYEGILGYKTDLLDDPNYETEKDDAMKVVERLKETGWSFASHSQGHRWSNDITYNLFVNDTDRWEREVSPLIGSTSVYIYPYGQGVATNDPKFEYMKTHGFAFFCTVSNTSVVQNGKDFAIQGRRSVDGIALRDKRLYDILNSWEILDPIRPSYAQWENWAKAKGILK